jgi:hypothetical protein
MDLGVQVPTRAVQVLARAGQGVQGVVAPLLALGRGPGKVAPEVLAGVVVLLTVQKLQARDGPDGQSVA